MLTFRSTQEVTIYADADMYLESMAQQMQQPKEELLKLYDNSRLTVVDAALTAGFPNEQIFPKRGKAINFTVNGSNRIARGEAGEAAVITMNGKIANINTPLEPNCEIIIDPSTAGRDAVYTVSQLDEYTSATVGFVVNGNLSKICTGKWKLRTRIL